jgi:hypothetical protein
MSAPRSSVAKPGLSTSVALAIAAALPMIIGFGAGRSGLASVASLFLVFFLPLVALMWVAAILAAAVVAIVRPNLRARAMAWIACVFIGTVAGAFAAAWGGILFHAHDSRNAVALLTGAVGATLGAACGGVLGALCRPTDRRYP